MATVLAIPMTTAAETWQVKPSISAGVQYDDNIRLSVDSADGVAAAKIAGTLELSRLTEAAEWRGLVRADGVNYEGDERGLEHTSNQLVRVSGLQKGERNRIGLVGSYKRDTLLRTIDAVFEPGDVTIEPDEDVDDALVTRSVRRNRAILRPTWTYNLSERAITTLRYNLNDVSYEDAEETDLFDYQQHTVTGQWAYRVSEKDKFRTTLEASRYRAPDPDREYITYAALAGYDYSLSETVRLAFDAGWRQTDFETPEEEGEDSGFLLGIESTKDAGLSEYSASLQRKLFPSGAGDVVEADELILNFTREVSETARFTLRTRLYQSESLRDNPRVNRRYLSVEPLFRWNLSTAWSVDLSYRYRRQKRDIDDESAESNAVYATLNYSMPTPFD